MRITARHRRVARAVWEADGRIDDAARASGQRADRIRRWLTEPAFRALLAEEAFEPLLQATSAVIRWSPAAVARLIGDLESESASEARQAAREILKLAIDAQKEMAASAREAEDAARHAPPDTDPLSRRVAALSDGQIERIWAILNEPRAEGGDS